MGVLRTRLEWYKNKGKSEIELIQDFTKINIRIGSELKNNVMNITFNNPFGRVYKRKYLGGEGKLPFQVDDVFKCYAKNDIDNSGIDTSSDSNDLLFVGELRDMKSKVDDNNAVIELKCTDRSFNLLNGIWTYAYQRDGTDSPNGQGWTAPLIIQHVIRHKVRANQIIPNDPQFVYDNEGYSPPKGLKTELLLIDARLRSESNDVNSAFNGKGFIQDNRTVTIDKNGTQTTRSNFGTPDYEFVDNDSDKARLFPSIPISPANYNFPLKDYAIVGKPIYEILLDLSQVDMTNTEDETDPEATSFTPVIKRAMRFYIDEKNRFHWFYPSDSVDSDKLGNGLTITMGTTNTYEVKSHDLNFTVTDIFNYIYFEAGDDMNGNTIIGQVYDPTSGAPIFKQSKRVWPKIAENMKYLDLKAENITKNADGSYNYPTAYPVTPAWNSTLTINDNATYNSEFKKTAVITATNRSNRLISQSQYPKWKGKIDFYLHNFTVGDLIKYTSEDGGIKNEYLRITEVNYDISKSGGFTSLTVEADPKEIEA